MSVLGLRSPFLRARAKEAETIVRSVAKASKISCDLMVEPVIRSAVTNERRDVTGYRYIEASRMGKTKTGAWRTEYGEIIESAHVTLVGKGGHSRNCLMAQVVVKPLYFGKPDVNYQGEDFKQIAEEIALALKKHGNYLFMPKVNSQLVPSEWTYRVVEEKKAAAEA